jgi:hypothetical protein
VVNADGHAVDGVATVLPGDVGWMFQPSQDWRPGQHQLIVNARLEDLAGNSMRRVFDRDLTVDADFVTQAESVVLPLNPRRNNER